eukprot:jgi/Botrbrau1/23042/Bobra.136_1s0031.1
MLRSSVLFWPERGKRTDAPACTGMCLVRPPFLWSVIRSGLACSYYKNFCAITSKPTRVDLSLATSRGNCCDASLSVPGVRKE